MQVGEIRLEIGNKTLGGDSIIPMRGESLEAGAKEFCQLVAVCRPGRGHLISGMDRRVRFCMARACRVCGRKANWPNCGSGRNERMWLVRNGELENRLSGRGL